MRKSGMRLRLLLLLVATLFLNGLSPAFASWTASSALNANDYSRFTSDPSFFSMSSMAVQTDGVAHLAYLERRGKRYAIVHASNETGSWKKETVKSSAAKLGLPSVAVYNGRLHIVWARGGGSNSEIVYARDTGGGWSISRMTANSVPDVSPTITMRRGKVYIAWIRAPRLQSDGSTRAGVVYVKTNASGRWRGGKIGNSHFWPSTPVMKVDGRGGIHVVYDASMKRGSSSIIIHADNTRGFWRQEKVPVDVDGTGKISDAQLPSLALYKSRVYVAFMSAPRNSLLEYARIALAVKKAGTWRVRALSKKSQTSIALIPRIDVSKGRVRVAYTTLGQGANGSTVVALRYMELVKGRLRGGRIASVSSTPESTDAAPSFTVLMMTGFDYVRGVAHAVYLRLVVDLDSPKIISEFVYSRRDP